MGAGLIDLPLREPTLWLGTNRMLRKYTGCPCQDTLHVLAHITTEVGFIISLCMAGKLGLTRDILFVGSLKTNLSPEYGIGRVFCDTLIQK